MEMYLYGTEDDKMQQVINLTLAGVAGAAGCLTLIIVVAAVLGGLWLDARLKSPNDDDCISFSQYSDIDCSHVDLVRLATSKIKPIFTQPKSRVIQRRMVLEETHKRHRGVNRWFVLFFIVLGAVFAFLIPPLRPHIQVAPEM